MMKKFDLNATCTLSDLIDIAANLYLIADRYHDRAQLAKTERDGKSWDALSINYMNEENVIENTIWELFKTDLDAVQNEIKARFNDLKHEEVTESPF